MNQYHRLYRVAKKYYPQEGGFCSVIATAVAMGCAFGKARSLLYRDAGRRNKRGPTVQRHLSVMNNNGYDVKRVTVKSKTLITVQNELANTEGTYFVYTREHVTCIQDGVCEDWTNNEQGRRTKYAIRSVYKITKRRKLTC